MTRAALAFLGGYLLGSFPSAVVVGLILRGEDIRRRGSGNPGTANALRVLGFLPGLIIFVLDAGKGLLAVELAASCLGPAHAWPAGLAAVVGHIFPLYAGFRGGKGLATGAGVIIRLFPWALGAFLPVWAGIYLWRRHVPPASCVAVMAVAVLALILLPPGPASIVCLGCILIFLRHWPEVRRGKKTGEPKAD